MVQLGALVTLYSSQEDKTSAADVLSKAISWYQNNDVSISSVMQSCVCVSHWLWWWVLIQISQVSFPLWPIWVFHWWCQEKRPAKLLQSSFKHRTLWVGMSKPSAWVVYDIRMTLWCIFVCVCVSHTFCMLSVSEMHSYRIIYGSSLQPGGLHCTFHRFLWRLITS